MGGDVPIGDAFKLYWHFFRFDGNGTVGIVLAIFLYVVTLFTASCVVYMYFLRLHNNGRLMDVYHRLHAREDEFFIPYDLEISNVELNYVCKKSEQWRGEEGERRKTAVYDYIWEEEKVCVCTLNEVPLKRALKKHASCLARVRKALLLCLTCERDPKPACFFFLYLSEIVVFASLIA